MSTSRGLQQKSVAFSTEPTEQYMTHDEIQAGPSLQNQDIYLGTAAT